MVARETADAQARLSLLRFANVVRSNFKWDGSFFLFNQDTTPLPRPVRSCTKKTPVPKRLLDQTESMVIDEALPSAERPVETEIGKKTPNRYKS